MGEVVDVLDRRVYNVPDVDRVLGLLPGTARRWIDGYTRGGKSYPPVVRIESTGDPTVTWGEFVETRLLAEYRGAGVPMLRLRPAVDRLREKWARYPLAHAAPFVEPDGRELVMKIQAEARLAAPMHLVVVRNGQTILTGRAQSFVNSVDYQRTPIAHRLRPVAGIDRVWVDPLIRSGEPVVSAVPTEVLAGLYRAGDSVEDLADWYEASVESIEAALRYERAPGYAA